MTTLNKNSIWVYLLSICFILIQVLIINNDKLEFLFLTPGMLALPFLFAALDKIWFFVVLTTPISINYYFPQLKLGFNIPNEPLLFILLVLFLLKFLINPLIWEKTLRHPNTLAIFLLLLWLFITTLTSQLLFVSIKSFIAYLWFTFIFYFTGSELFRNTKHVKKFIWLYTSTLLIVIFYTWYRHSAFNFSQEKSYIVTRPLFDDHAVYGAAIALFIPTFLSFTFNKSLYKNRISVKVAALVISIILIIALLLSYSRGALLSTIASLAFYFALKLKIKFRTLLFSTVALLGLFILFQKEIYQKLVSNEETSSANYTQHLKSSANVSTDMSNLERINRWDAAIRMVKEKPLLGFGPATYMFEYGPYQDPNKMTIISTTIGDAGGVHSEYLRHLVESGILGLLIFLFFIGIFVFKGMDLYYKTKNKETKALTCTILIALVGYLVHGFLNNFLDLDKIAVPFWSFVGILTALDINNSAENEKVK